MADPARSHDAATPGSATTLRYTSPPEGWVEALPIGNGHLGAMVFAGTARDRLQINDDTCWSGSPRLAPVRGADLPTGRARRCCARPGPPSRTATCGRPSVRSCGSKAGTSSPTSRSWTCG
ncbi:glycoside hydrolase N-terminal domain-containing protein [Cellulomonas sp. ATA003]|uniref:glycoside hydrolase N-terminal domain-containing protein n=1 Tax=Cellulomonas sp. ATA003 TaxID=3073064 RepID=UPI0037C1577F